VLTAPAPVAPSRSAHRRPAPPSPAGCSRAAAGLAVGELLGRLLPGADSPVLAVAARVVDLTPTPLRRTAIDAAGTADKPLLLAGVLLVAALLAAYGGRLAQYRPRSAQQLVLGLSLLVLLAQLPQPAVGPGALVVAAGLMLTTLGVLRSLLRLAVLPGADGRGRSSPGRWSSGCPWPVPAASSATCSSART
jgi:hypothetical protein